MKALKLLIVIGLISLTIAAQNAVPPKGIEAPKIVTATESQSLRFRNSLLEIQALRSQAEALTARANLLQATLPDQIAVIQKDAKIDAEKYAVMRSSGGAYILSDDGLLQFQLREPKKE